MLARADQLHQGAQAWRETGVPKTTARRTEVDARYGIAEPEIEVPFAWETWHAGYGDNDLRSTDRYRTGYHDTRWPGKIQAAPDVSLTTLSLGAVPSGTDAFFFQMQQKYFLGIGRYVIQTHPTATLLRDFGAGKTVRGAVVYKDKAFLGVGTPSSNGFVLEDNFWTFDGNTTFSQNPAGLKASYWTLARDKAWRSYYDAATNRYLVAAGDGDLTLTANWGGGFAVGDASSPITGMTEYNGGPVVAKTDGVYAYVESDNQFKNVLPAWRSALSEDNGKALVNWQGALLAAAERGLTRLREVNWRTWEAADIGPGRVVQQGTPDGHFMALAPDGPWVWGMLYQAQSDSTFLVTGRLQAEGEGIAPQGGMVWHHFQEFGASEVAASTRKFRALGINTVPVMSGGNPRLTFALPNTSATVGWYEVILPRAGGDPAKDSACRFNSSIVQGRKFTTPFHDLGAPTTKKTFIELSVETEDVTGSVYVIAAIASPSTTATLGVISTSGRRTFAIDNAAFPDTFKARVELNVVGTGNLTPKVRKIVGKAILRPEFVEVREVTVRLADQLPLRDPGMTDPRTAAMQLADLQALTRRGVVTLRTPLGVEEQVVVLGPIQVREAAQLGRAEPEFLASFRMRKLGESSGNYFRWDGNAKWNGQSQWS